LLVGKRGMRVDFGWRWLSRTVDDLLPSGANPYAYCRLLAEPKRPNVTFYAGCIRRRVSVGFDCGPSLEAATGELE
jgi:hypothetical protein